MANFDLLEEDAEGVLIEKHPLEELTDEEESIIMAALMGRSPEDEEDEIYY
jgi:hypothetical protein